MGASLAASFLNFMVSHIKYTVCTKYRTKQLLPYIYDRPLPPCSIAGSLLTLLFSGSQRLTQRVSLSKCAHDDRDGLWKTVLHNRRQPRGMVAWWWGTLKRRALAHAEEYKVEFQTMETSPWAMHLGHNSVLLGRRLQFDLGRQLVSKIQLSSKGVLSGHVGRRGRHACRVHLARKLENLHATLLLG